MRAVLIEVFCVLALGIFSISEGIRLVLGSKLHKYDIIGPGYYSIGMGAILIVAALAYLWFERKKMAKIGQKKAGGQSAGESKYTVKMITMIVIIMAYLILMSLIGYLFATFVFFLLINKIAGFRSWATSIGAAVLMTACFYLLFVVWMGIMFPQGLLINI
jgi:hypothetical protein